MKKLLDFRNKTYLIFYISGLSVAMAGFLLSFIYVRHEINSDRFHKHHQRIFRAETQFLYGQGKEQLQATSPIPLAPSLKKDFPEVKDAVRISRPYPETLLSTKAGKKFIENQGIWADNSFFKIFSFTFISGSSENVLTQPLSIVLTEKLAKKIFLDEDFLGKIVRVNNKLDYKVTGVIKDIPLNSHLDFSFVVSSDFSGTLVGGWNSNMIFTYVLLKKGIQKEEFSRNLAGILKEHGVSADKEIYLKPLSKIYLSPEIFFEFTQNGNRKIVNLCFWVALLILFTASVVFTEPVELESKSGFRAKIKTVIPGLFLKTSVSGIFAALIFFVFFPLFAQLVNRSLMIDLPSFLLFLVLLIIITGLFSALSAGFLIRGKNRFRKTFIMLQLFFFLLLFLAFLKISDRAFPLKNENQAIDKDNIVTMDLSRLLKDNLGKCMAFKNELLKNPHILDACFSLHLPFGIIGTSAVAIEKAEPDKKIMANVNFINVDFLDTYGLELIGESRDISPQTEMLPGEWVCLINETAADGLIGKKNNSTENSIIGKRVVFSEENKPTIIGVVRDFPFSFSQDRVEPLVLIFQKNHEFIYPKLSFRLYPGDMINTLDFMQNKFEFLFPEDEFVYRSFEKYYSGIFQDDMVLKNILGFFSVAAFFIFIIGLLSRRAQICISGEEKRDRFFTKNKLIFFGFIQWFVVYLYILVFIEPHLFYYGFGKMMKLPLYLPGWQFVRQSIAHPGEIINFAEGILSQFFSNNWAGALVITAVAWGISVISRRIITLVGTKSNYRILCYIPALLFIMSYNNYDHPLSSGLALLVALLFSVLYIKFSGRQKTTRILWFCILFAFLYFITIGASLLFALVAIIIEGFSRRNYKAGAFMFVITILCPYLAGIWIFDFNLSTIYLSLTPFISGSANIDSALILQSMFLFMPVLLIFLILFSSKKAGLPSSKKLITKILPTAVLLVVFILTNVITFNKNKKVLYKLMYFSHIGKWEQVLKQARKLPPNTYNLYNNYQINRALYHTGQLGEEMFSYLQDMDAIALIPFETERIIMRDAAVIDISLELGSLNIAEHLSLELMEVAGNSPFFLQDLALINMGKKQTETARVFLNALSRNRIFRNKALHLLRQLDKDPDLKRNRRVQYLRRVMLEKDIANIDIETLLLNMLEKNRYNRMAFEYLMAYYLMERKVDKVAENFSRLNELGYKKIPRHYEEAVLLYSMGTDGKINLYGKKLRPETMEKFYAFSEIMSSSQEINRQVISREMMQKFGSTYFYYYSFGRSGVAR